MTFTLANGMDLVSDFGILVLIFLVCRCQMQKGCLQHSQGKGMLGFLAVKTSSSSTPTTIKVQEKQQFRDEAVQKLKLGKAVCCLDREKQLKHLYFCLGTGVSGTFQNNWCGRPIAGCKVLKGMHMPQGSKASELAVSNHQSACP